MMWALAHPLRFRILELLREGPGRSARGVDSASIDPQRFRTRLLPIAFICGLALIALGILQILTSEVAWGISLVVLGILTLFAVRNTNAFMRRFAKPS